MNLWNGLFWGDFMCIDYSYDVFERIRRKELLSIRMNHRLALNIGVQEKMTLKGQVFLMLLQMEATL